MSIVRVKADVSATIYDPAAAGYVALVPGVEFDSNDPFVKANSWAFQADAETEAKPRARSVTLDPGVEQATANPGEKRTTRR